MHTHAHLLCDACIACSAPINAHTCLIHASQELVQQVDEAEKTMKQNYTTIERKQVAIDALNKVSVT